MFKWLSKMIISHFGVLNPSFMRGYYTGVGRALYLLEQLNNSNSPTRKEQEEDEDDGDGD